MNVCEKIFSLIRILQVETRYFRLVLLVGESGSGKTRTLRELSNKIDAEIFNVGLLAREVRYKNTLNALSFLHEINSNPLILDNTEFLFDKKLKHDPLVVLQHCARDKTMIASWSGHFDDNTLTYAEPSHGEYRCYHNPDSIVVQI